MQKLLLIALCLLPLSIFAQTEQTFEQRYGMTWEQMVERHKVSTTTTSVKTPMVENKSCTEQILSPKEELAGLKRQKNNIEGNIKHLSLNADSADPELMKKYKNALAIKNKRIATLEKNLGLNPTSEKRTKDSK